MARELAVIGAPSGAGACGVGQERAPAALRGAGLIEALTDCGFDVSDLGDSPFVPWRPDRARPRAQNLEAVVDVVRATAARVAEALVSLRSRSPSSIPTTQRPMMACSNVSRRDLPTRSASTARKRFSSKTGAAFAFGDIGASVPTVASTHFSTSPTYTSVPDPEGAFVAAAERRGISVPVLSIGIAYVWLDEVPATVSVLGGGIAIIGVVIVRGTREREAVASKGRFR